MKLKLPSLCSDEEKDSCSTCGEFRATLKKCSKCKQVSNEQLKYMYGGSASHDIFKINLLMLTILVFRHSIEDDYSIVVDRYVDNLMM